MLTDERSGIEDLKKKIQAKEDAGGHGKGAAKPRNNIGSMRARSALVAELRTVENASIVWTCPGWGDGGDQAKVSVKDLRQPHPADLRPMCMECLSLPGSSLIMLLNLGPGFLSIKPNCNHVL